MPKPPQARKEVQAASEQGIVFLHFVVRVHPAHFSGDNGDGVLRRISSDTQESGQRTDASCMFYRLLLDRISPHTDASCCFYCSPRIRVAGVLALALTTGQSEPDPHVQSVRSARARLTV